MKNNSFVPIHNATFVESLYNQYLINKNSVDKSWQEYFESLSNDESKSSNTIINHSHEGYDLLYAYRQSGHMNARIDPLERIQPSFQHQIKIQDEVIDLSDRSAFQFINMNMISFEKLLKQTYCNTIGFEIEHIENIHEKNWLYSKIEGEAWKLHDSFDIEDRRAFLTTLLRTKMFENFLHTKFVGAKRFSIEGGESYILALQECVKLSAVNGIHEIVLGMAHRGRLSTLVQVLNKPHSNLFAGFMGYTTTSEFPSFVGDVKYHLGYEHDIVIDGHNLHLTLAYNPSHLESVNSVVMGMVKAKQQNESSVIPILVHGDASFAGQGCVMEALAMSKIEPYDTGGIIHFIINNQIGFTTDVQNDRSTRYCSDVAKGYNIPILHVNGNDPEAIVYAVNLAFEYRQKFAKDVVIDIVCYRKYGHNEGDEPMFTQPSMYSQIHSKDFKDCVDLYREKLEAIGEKFDDIQSQYMNFLNEEFEIAKKILTNEIPYEHSDVSEQHSKHIECEKRAYSLHTFNQDIGISLLGNTDISELQSVVTGVPINTLKELSTQLLTIPSSFHLNSKIARQFEAKKEMMESGQGIDWGQGEWLAFALILMNGFNIRFTGEDVERGTFSHRHAMLTDQTTFQKHSVFDKKMFIRNSLLSEFGVLGYEYGYATENFNTLTIWEAQFGDFANGAQIIIDQYLAAAESKWGVLNNLVMLLPHGYEGQGPEHSSGRLERFLQLCAQNNLQVCNCTTPASLFHLLRRQVLQSICKPLIIMTPKSLLRHKMAVSSLADMSEGSTFMTVIPDEVVINPKRVILCTGKVYYDLIEFREKHCVQNVSIVRIEQLYPFPIAKIRSIVSKCHEIVWCQEEPQNMGAFSFVQPILQSICNQPIVYAGRKSAASPAVGFTTLHTNELDSLLKGALF